jgi:hypothetical protein
VDSWYYLFGIPILRKHSPGLTADQLNEWEAADRLDPIGEWRADFRMAELASVVTNIAIKWGAGKKKVKLAELMDFMPQWDVKTGKDPKQQSMEEMRQALQNIYEHSLQVQQRKRQDTNRPPEKLKRKGNG